MTFLSCSRKCQVRSCNCFTPSNAMRRQQLLFREELNQKPRRLPSPRSVAALVSARPSAVRRKPCDHEGEVLRTEIVIRRIFTWHAFQSVEHDGPPTYSDLRLLRVLFYHLPDHEKASV